VLKPFHLLTYITESVSFCNYYEKFLM
jgi:hypothetical protein